MIKLRMWYRGQLLSLLGWMILKTEHPGRLQKFQGWSRAALERQMADRAKVGIRETYCHTSWSFGVDDDIPRR